MTCIRLKSRDDFLLWGFILPSSLSHYVMSFFLSAHTERHGDDISHITDKSRSVVFAGKNEIKCAGVSVGYCSGMSTSAVCV